MFRVVVTPEEPLEYIKANVANPDAPPSPPGAELVAQRLNMRFRYGQPSSTLAGTEGHGVVFHQFDDSLPLILFLCTEL